MSIWNKVLIGLILLASIGLFVLTARALKTHEYWREQVRQNEEDLAKQLADEQKLSEEVRQLKIDVHEQVLGRGRVWYGCQPQPNELTPTGEVSVITAFADHGITANTVVWVFDELDAPKGGRYLGQFTVTGIAGQGLRLRPTMRMSTEDLDKLQKAARQGAIWALCELMPTDSHEALAGLDKKQLSTMLPGLPENTLEEYVLDGQKEVKAEDVETKGLPGKVLAIDETGEVIYVDDQGEVVRIDSVDESGQLRFVDGDGNPHNGIGVVAKELDAGTGKYVRQLRNYEELFRQHYLEWSRLNEEIETTRREASDLKAVYEDAVQQLAFRQKEREQLATDLKDQQGLRDAALERFKEVQQALDATRKDIAKKIQDNQAMAGEIARIQQEAARLIDERTQRMARTGAGD